MPSNVRIARKPAVWVVDSPTCKLLSLVLLLATLTLVLPGNTSAAQGPPINTTPPVVSGVAVVGSTLSASAGSWSSPGQVQSGAQWQRCTAVMTCTTVSGATAWTYAVTPADVGFAVRVVVTAANRWGSAAALSALTSFVPNPSSGPGLGTAPVNTGLPLVSGVAKVGSLVSSSTGTWTGTTPISYAYQWRRCDASGGACAAILGASASTFTPTPAEVGSTLRVALTASNAVATSTAMSSPTAPVVALDPPPTGVTRPIGINQVGKAWSGASGYERYGYLVVGRSVAPAAALQPGTSLVYHSGTSVNVNWDAGVPYSVASANGWLLRDVSGAYLRNLAYPDNYIGDVGSSAYQADWARRVGDYLASVGADGVYIDDVIADISTMSGVFPSKYPNQAAWETAMASFVASVGPALKSRGFYVLISAHKFVSGNLGSNDGSLEAQWWQRVGPSVSGLHTEYWVQDGTNVSRLRAVGAEWWNQWDGWQRLVQIAQSVGADFFGYTEGSISNGRAMRYGKASFLLDWDGGGGAFIYAATDASDPWNAAWTADIGRPTAPKTLLAGGVWMRRYERGTVLVNPTLATVTVTVDGVVRTIGATDAMILTT